MFNAGIAAARKFFFFFFESEARPPSGYKFIDDKFGNHIRDKNGDKLMTRIIP